MQKQVKGFNLIEVLIALAISSLVVTLLLETFSSAIKSKLKSQQKLEHNIQSNNVSFWFTQVFSKLGQYNFYGVNSVSNSTKLYEQALVQQNPILFHTNNVTGLDLISLEATKSDKLVVLYQASKGCNGQDFGYDPNHLWLVIDEIFIQHGNLRCKSHDARYLLGLSNQPYSSRSVSLMQGIRHLQIKYLSLHNNFYAWLDAAKIQQHHDIKAARVTLTQSSMLNSIVITLPISKPNDGI